MLISWILLLTAAYPLGVAWRANRRTPLIHSVQWAMLAWAAWAAVLVGPAWPDPMGTVLSYIALSLTGCAGVAVLGARRPGVTAWNFVVGGLLAVLLLPLLEGVAHLSPPRLVFLGAVVAVALLNYLPTRWAPAVLLLGIGCGVEFLGLVLEGDLPQSVELMVPLSRCLLAVSPWVALARSYGRRPRSEFDRLWLHFRDRFGLLWSQRMREQFNRSAVHAGWPVQLRWKGLRRSGEVAGLSAADQKEMVATLRALLKRFGPEEKGAN